VCLCSSKPFYSRRLLINWSMLRAGKTNGRGRLRTVDLLIKVACFVKKLNNNCNIKGPDLNELVQGGLPL
jgi:hypothetical protein